MKRLIKLCIVVLAVALVSTYAFAEVQNVKVSGDVNSGAVIRKNYDLLNATNSYRDKNNSSDLGGESEYHNFLYTQARVRVDADLTDNVAATIRLLTEWDWNTEDNTYSDGDDVDMDLANVTLKEAFYQPLTVIIGRQELKYGNAFIIGDPDTNATSKDGNFTAGDLSLRKSFDSIRAILDYNPWTIDLIFAKIDETALATGSLVSREDDEDLYGINAAYKFNNYDAEAEGYFFLTRDDDSRIFERSGGNAQADSTSPGHEIQTFGARGSVSPMDDLVVSGEMAWQRGNFDKTTTGTAKRDQDAFAFQIAGNYALTIEGNDWEPMVRAGWTHYSGEEVDDTGDQQAWIPLYEDQTHGIVANYVLGGINGGQNSNADILNIGATIQPLEDLTVSIDFYKFWLDKNIVTSNNASPSTSDRLDWTNITTEAEYDLLPQDDLGYEVDIALDYDYTEDVNMGLVLGLFVPGDVFEGTTSVNTNDETALELLATVDVAF